MSSSSVTDCSASTTLAYARVFWTGGISFFYYYFLMLSDVFPLTDLSVVIEAFPVVIDFLFFFSPWDSSDFSSSFGTREDTKGAGGFTIVRGTERSCFVREDLPPLRVVVVERSKQKLDQIGVLTA
jgi:hypothetical protein